MKSILIFLTTTLISYLATIPPGPLSLFVVHTTLQKNIKIAIWVATGGVICEIFYAFFASFGVGLFIKNPEVVYWLQRAIIFLLISVGVYTFFQNSEKIAYEKVSLNGRLISFLKGVSLSLFNPALLPFWLVVLVAYQNYSFLTINTFQEKTAMVLGAGTGTFLLVFTYAMIADKKREIVFKYLTDNRLNKLIGLIFIGLALLQILNLLF
ncbi:MAG: LysE family transporter [Bacteroidota bacterium]